MKQIKFALLAIMLSAFAASASADTYQLFWKKANSSGTFSNEAMWYDTGKSASSTTEHFGDGADRFFRLDSATGAGTTNTVLLTDYNLLGGLNIYLWAESAITLDGADAVFRQHATDGGDPVNNTVYEVFGVRNNDYSVQALDFKSADRANSSTISFSNSLQTLSRSTSGSWIKWHFRRGRFSFAEPDADNAAHTVTLGSSSNGEGMFEVLFDGVEAIFPKVVHNCYNTNSVMRVKGGDVKFLGSFGFDAGGSAVGWRAFAGTNKFIVCDGGKFTQVGGTTTLGLLGNAALRRDVVEVTGAGSTYTVGAGADHWNMEANSGLVVRDGATWNFLPVKDIRIGANIAGKDSTDAMATLLVDGDGTVFNGVGSNLLGVYYDGSAVFSGGADVRLSKNTVVGGSAKRTGTLSTMSVSGDGTLVTVDGTNNGTQALRVGEQAGRGVVNVSGGTLRGAASNHAFMLRLGIAQGDEGTLNVSGGTVDVGGGVYGQLYVGMSGRGTLNVSGGLVTGQNLCLGYGSTMTLAQTSTVNQTGGVIDMANSGLTLCFYGDSAKRTSIVDLDGGTTRVTRVRGEKTVASGFLGRAELHADGGTIVPKASKYTETDPFICGIDEFTIGDGGLTIDTGVYDTLVKQPMSDAAGESGILVKKGSATLTLTGGGYAVSNTRVDEGTLLVTNETASLSTSLSVTTNGTISLVGSATSLSLDGLSVFGGTIALDPGDVINVSGPVSLEGLTVSFSSLPALDGGAVGFIVCDGELDEASARAVKRALTANEAASDAYVEFNTAYDAETGKTTVSVVHATESAPIGDDSATFWNGAGANWGAVDGWSAGVPTGEKPAVFPDSVAAKSVAVPGAASAAALSFRADGYSVSGTGPLSIDGKRGAAQIEVTSGSAVVGVPLVLGTSTKIPVAAGASLTLSGAVSDGGLEKSGSGALTISGVNDFFLKAALLGGVTTLASANALSGAPEIALAGGSTLVFGVAQDVSQPISVSSTYAAPAILKADAAVTASRLDVFGSLIKRGAGCFTLDVSGAGGTSTVTTAKNSASEGAPSSTAITFFPEDGSAPAAASCWAGFTVAEGEFVLRGSSSSPAVSAAGSVSIGMNATNMDENAQARLTIDGATLDNLTGVTSPFLVGSGTSLQYTRQFTPTLAVLNGAFLKAYRVVVGRNTYGGAGRHATMLVTNSTVYASDCIQFSNNDAADNNKAITRASVANLLTAGNFRMQGRFDVEVDGTYVGRGDVTGARLAAPVKMRVDTYNVQQPGGTFALRNGSVLSAYFENMNYPTNPIEFVWDDSEWRWAAALGSYTFAASSVNTSLFKFTMEGRGIVLKPAAGATFTTEVPFTGEGGMRNLGEGTVKFAADTYKFTGVCEVAEGATVDLSDAGTVSDAKFTGLGTVSGGTFAGNSRILLSGAADDWSDADAPTFDGCTFGGRVLVDFGRSSENPLDEPGTSASPVVVAKFTGAAPDVSKWKLLSSSTGLRSVGGTFSIDAERGEVLMAPCRVGAILIVK